MKVRTSLTGLPVAEILLDENAEFTYSHPVSIELSVCERFALYFTYEGEGVIDFSEFTLI